MRQGYNRGYGHPSTLIGGFRYLPGAGSHQLPALDRCFAHCRQNTTSHSPTRNPGPHAETGSSRAQPPVRRRIWAPWDRFVTCAATSTYQVLVATSYTRWTAMWKTWCNKENTIYHFPSLFREHLAARIIGSVTMSLRMVSDRLKWLGWPFKGV